MWRFGLLIAALTLLYGCGCGVGIPGDNKDTRTPLEKAATEADVAQVRRLLAGGADANEKTDIYGSPLAAASTRPNNLEIVRLLLASGADPNGRAPEGDRCWVSPLEHSLLDGYTDTASALYEAGASLKARRCADWNAAWLRPPSLDLLVSHGYDLRVVDDQGRNQLHMALAGPGVPYPETVEYLLRAQVPVNARDKQGKTPLAYWNEPRHYEKRWFVSWMFERLTGDPDFRNQRERRRKISELLTRAGAVM